MANERVMASVTLKSRSGLSVFKDRGKLSLSRIHDFRPKPNYVDQAISLLKQAGFTFEAQTEMGASFSGPKELFESEFGEKIHLRTMMLPAMPGVRPRSISFHQSSKPLLMSRRIESFAEGVQLAIPAVPLATATAPAPNPTYYYLDVLNDVPDLFNVTALHNQGITGTGIRISMIDSGFIIRITESYTSIDKTHVLVNNAVRNVKGVWLASDPGHTGTNYFTGGSFAGTMITLGKALPQVLTGVQVTYSCLHPHYLAQNYHIDDIRAVGGLDVNADEYGHGTAEAANALAVAPGCTFSFVKDSDNFSSYSLAGFQSAVQHQNPNVITCSWGTFGTDNALAAEIVNAVANGIVVIFSAGNGHVDDPSSLYANSVTHPDLISVGGAYPIQGGGFRASNYASSFDSYVYTNPQRHIPDVVGLVGEQPRACLIMLPTQPSDTMDDELSSSGAFPNGDNTGTGDGWVVCSGTSAAAPQTAGVAALLLQHYGNLTPMAIKNILENSAQDITTGTTNTASGGDSAGPGWDAATGFGLIDGQAAINYLHVNQFSPYIRDSVEDNGTEPVVADRLYASPDIIVRTEPVDDPQTDLGQTVKQRLDLCDTVEAGQDNYVYMRVQNRGTLPGNCTGTIYFTDPGMFYDPASWTKIVSNLAIQNLQPGEFRVVGPIVWPANLVPATGHYCMISILDSPGDPAPDLAAIHSTDDFVNMVRNSNNVAWHNIDVEDVIPGAGSYWSFSMEHHQTTACTADLQVDLSNFPGGGTVLVKMIRRLADTATLNNMVVAEQSQAYTTFRHLGAIGGIDGMAFKPNEKVKVTVYYATPANAPKGSYSIVATLHINGQIVNSYSKIVNVMMAAFIGNRRTLEIHKPECVWVRAMSPYNKLPLDDLVNAHKRGFDNCATCIGGSLR